jgi:hypothetical protein
MFIVVMGSAGDVGLSPAPSLPDTDSKWKPLISELALIIIIYAGTNLDIELMCTLVA